MSTLAATWDAHVKDMGQAVCGSCFRSLTQDVTSDMKFTDTLGAISKYEIYCPAQSFDRHQQPNPLGMARCQTLTGGM